jgi:hypothetical protein
MRKWFIDLKRFRKSSIPCYATIHLLIYGSISCLRFNFFFTIHFPITICFLKRFIYLFSTFSSLRFLLLAFMRMENMKILYMAVRTVLRAEQTRLLVGPGSLITRTPACQIGTVLNFKLRTRELSP